MTATEPSRRLDWRAAELARAIVETPRARSLVFRVPGWPGHLAGQHVDVRLTADDGYQVERSYSIASPPEWAEVVLTVDRIDDGEVSPFLTEEARPGDRIELRGPIGGYFTWRAGPEPLQLFAGGSGIVPLMAMLRHRALAAHKPPARLLYSSRSWELAIFGEELSRLAREDPGLIVAHTLTRQAPPGWAGARRRVDAAMIRDHAFTPGEAPIVYVCGPTPFVETVASELADLGHPPERIKTERFGPTGGPT